MNTYNSPLKTAPKRVPYRSRRLRERGQTLIVFILSSVIILTFVAMAADGGYGLYVSSEAQNAADFAALATSSFLQGNCTSTSASVPESSVQKVMTTLVDDNLPNVLTGSVTWKGDWLTQVGDYVDTGTSTAPSGADITSTSTGAALVPSTACGLAITVIPTWSSFIRPGGASATSAAYAEANAIFDPSNYFSVSIVALGTNQTHDVFVQGSGNFVVDGTLASNANGIVAENIYSPSNRSLTMNWGTDNSGVGGPNMDVIDMKDTSKMTVVGILQSYANDPFDTCFHAPPGSGTPLASGSSNTSGSPTLYEAQCSNGGQMLYYNGWKGSQTPVANPLAADANPAIFAGCPGAASYNAVNPTPTTGATLPNGSIGTIYYPGIYPSLVQITGNAYFEDCAGTVGPNNSNDAGGIYEFQNGLEVLPAQGDTVTINNDLLVGENPIPQFAGGGAPEHSWMVSTNDGQQYDPFYCASCTAYPLGGSSYGNPLPVHGFPFGTTGSAYGPNFSMDFGGQGTITVSKPFTDNFGDPENKYTGFAIWQDPNVIANIGLDAIPPLLGNNDGACSGSQADELTLCLESPTGTFSTYVGDGTGSGNPVVNINNSNIYDDSFPNGNLYCPTSPPQTGSDVTSPTLGPTACSTYPQYILANYYNSDGSQGGLPFDAGGALLAGSGDYCTENGAICSGGTININNGVVLVDSFSTNGTGAMTIVGAIDNIAGVVGSGPTLTG